MKHLAAYLLAMLGGQKQPTADSIKKILNSVGAQADDERINKLIEELKGKDMEQIIAAGQEKMSKAAIAVAAAPSGGAAAPAAAAGAAAAAPAAASKKEEVKEEEEEDLGMSLFD